MNRSRALAGLLAVASIAAGEAVAADPLADGIEVAALAAGPTRAGMEIASLAGPVGSVGNLAAKVLVARLTEVAELIRLHGIASGDRAIAEALALGTEGAGPGNPDDPLCIFVTGQRCIGGPGGERANPSPAPQPANLALLGGALVGLAALRRSRPRLGEIGRLRKGRG